MNETNNSLIDNLFLKKEWFAKESAKIDKAIQAFQDVCNHHWVEKSRTAHGDYEECTICRASRKV